MKGGWRRGALLMPKGTYTEWFWPPSPTQSRTIAAGFSSFEHTLCPEIDPGPEASYFWAHQFGLIGGEGGYIGLQTLGNRADGSLGKMAIFSVWNAIEGEGPGVVPFNGEGQGWSCRVAYSWVPGRVYWFRLESTEPSWWAASVVDETDGSETMIGRIRVPAAWRGLSSSSVMWTEYYGQPVTDCADLALSRVVFSTPWSGDVRPQSSNNHLGDQGSCSNSSVVEVPEGVRHEMGVGR